MVEVLSGVPKVIVYMVIAILSVEENSSDILPCAGPMSCQDSVRVVRVVHVPTVHRGSDL